MVRYLLCNEGLSLSSLLAAEQHNPDYKKVRMLLSNVNKTECDNLLISSYTQLSFQFQFLIEILALFVNIQPVQVIRY